ncbi:hypothetical protein ACFQPC_02835 [Herminiimonas glaciei]|uniref:Uncharacterized protein n=1 Tax=Herminiimonas glaciei TaxID=523788 RepID=A0ABW2I7L0_9BURK
MKSIEEFNVKSPSGNVVILQNIGKGRTYLDFGSTKLPPDFIGYRVKYTDKVAEPQKDGTFKIKGSPDSYSRI